jgi:hypothetical protein
MIRFLANLALCLGAGILWWIGNIEMGNVKALEYLGWLAAYPWWVVWVVAVLPSLSQLYITETWGEKMDPLSAVFTAFIAIVVDLGGPALGFYVVTGLPYNMGTLTVALVVALFASGLCQHVAWVRGKEAVAMALRWLTTRPAQKPSARPTRLMDRLPRQPKPHSNGKKEEPHDPKEVERHD